MRPDRLLSPQEAANLIGISANAVLAAIHNRQLFGLKVRAGKGWRYWIPRSDAERWRGRASVQRDAA